MGLFDFNKKTPEEAAKDGKKTLNTGLTGAFTKMFVGADAMNTINNSLDQVTIRQELMTSGIDATAEVLSIVDTGQLVNYDPVLKLGLNVTTSTGSNYTQEISTIVSKIQIPRVGEKVLLKVHATDKTKAVFLGITK